MHDEPPSSQRPHGLPLLWLLAAGFALFVLIASRPFATEPALRPGEELTYSVRWAVLPGAGQIRIAATSEQNEGSAQLKITTETETRGLARSLARFQARSESIFDVRSGRILSLHETSVARTKQTDYSLRFDPANRQALFSGNNGETPRVLELPEGDPADLITTLMKTRRWDLQPGESRDALVSFRQEFYLLTVHATKFERMKTPLGEFDTIVLEPRMEKTAPKGMFKRGGSVRVWVSRNDVRLPVRFEVEFKVGTGVATLVNYTPPRPELDSRLVAEE